MHNELTCSQQEAGVDGVVEAAEAKLLLHRTHLLSQSALRRTSQEGHLKSVCRSNAVSTQEQEIARAVAAQRKEACTRTSK